MDTKATQSSSIAQVSNLIGNSEPHFVYFYLNTYQQALYYSWIKDPSHTKNLEEYEKRRQALDEKLVKFFPSNIDDELCQTLRNVARLCARNVARELKVTLSYGKAEAGQVMASQEGSKALVSSVRVTIDSLQADMQMSPTRLCCETKFSNVPKQDSPEQFTLQIWLFDAAGKQLGDGPLVTVQEDQISGVNGFSASTVEPGCSSPRSIHVLVTWQIAAVQPAFPLLTAFWLHKIPLIIGHIGGETDANHNFYSSHWRLFAPGYRACVADWRRWPGTSGLACQVMHSLQKMYFLLHEAAQTDLSLRVLVTFCRETLASTSSEDKRLVQQIVSDTAFTRLLCNNLSLYHNQIRVAGQVTVLKWLAKFTTRCDIQTLFFLFKYNEQVVCHSEHYGKVDPNLLAAIGNLNAVLKKHAQQLDASLEVADITLAYTDDKGRVRNDQGEMRKLRGIKRRQNGALVVPSVPQLLQHMGELPSDLVGRISRYLIAQSVEMDKRIANALL